MAILSAHALPKRYGTHAAVDGLRGAAGGFFGPLGPDGAGKMTTMCLIYRVTPPTDGGLTVFKLKGASP